MATRINLLEWIKTKFNTKEEISDLLDDKLDVEHNTDNNAHSNILSAVAKSGSYNDLSNTPNIDSSLSTSSTNALQNKVVTDALDNKAETGHVHDSWTEVYNNKNLVIKYNSTIGLCHAKFSMSYNFTDNNLVKYITDVPSPYRPPTNMTCFAHPNGHVHISLNVGGTLQFRRLTNTGSVAIAGTWVYIGH